MPRRGAILTQADVARTIRAAKQAGATDIEVRPDGTMIVHLQDRPLRAPADDKIAWPKDVVL